MMIFTISIFSITPLQVWRRLSYIIMDDSGEELRGLSNSFTKEGLIADHWKT